MNDTLYATFANHELAEKAVGALLDHGAVADCISLVADERYARGGGQTLSDSRLAQGDIVGHAKHGVTTTTGGDAASGAMKGAGIGLGIGVLAALASLIIPGFGLVIGGGALAAALGAAAGTTAAGAIAGGVAGYLADMGVPDKVAQTYQEELAAGSSLLALHLPCGKLDLAQAQMLLNKYGASNVGNYPMNADRAGMAGTTAVADVPRTRTMGGDQVIPVVEEQLEVGKRSVQTGGVRVDTNVIEQPVAEDVQLRKESVTVERRPVDRAASPADLKTFESGSMEITERAEQAVVSKTPRVVEEVVISKAVRQENEHIQETIRRTNVEFTQLRPQFQQHFQDNLSHVGSYDDYEPAYQYGYELGNDPSYTGQGWDDLQGNARQGWEKLHPNTWDKANLAVRNGWERFRSRV